MLSNRESVETKLQRIAEKARREPNCQFTSLFHLMDKELLRGCFEGLRKDAASGIDRVTREEYGKDLETNLTGLVERLHRMSYIPLPVLRVYIPKPGSTKQRPLGIPALEDKLVQAGLARILGAIYEGDFIEDSYGFRPGRRCHDALRALSLEVEGGCVHHIVEADIKGFFDHVQHDWMMKFLGHRIADKRVQRYVKRFLIAGVLGHFAYCGVTDNSKGISRFDYEFRKLLFKWLNRRGKRGCMSWDKFIKFLGKYPLPRPRIMVNLFAARRIYG